MSSVEQVGKVRGVAVQKIRGDEVVVREIYGGWKSEGRKKRFDCIGREVKQERGIKKGEER